MFRVQGSGCRVEVYGGREVCMGGLRSGARVPRAWDVEHFFKLPGLVNFTNTYIYINIYITRGRGRQVRPPVQGYLALSSDID